MSGFGSSFGGAAGSGLEHRPSTHRVYCQQPHPKAASRTTCPMHLIGDVMEFQIEEYAKAELMELLDEGRASAGVEPRSDLDPA